MKYSIRLFAILFSMALVPGVLSANDGGPETTADAGDSGAGEKPSESDCD